MIKPYWQSMMSQMESCRPKPTRRSAVQPEMPMTVMEEAPLVAEEVPEGDLPVEKEMRLHSGVRRPSRMRLPALGARGSMSAAGVPRRLETTAPQVASNVMPTPSPPERSAQAGSMGFGKAIRGTA